MNIEDLINKFYYYTITVSIGEDELLDLYCCSPKYSNLSYENLVKIIKNDIKNDFENNIGKIKQQLQNDIDIYSINEDISISIEYPYILEIYQEIKKYYKDFYIEDIEKM